MAACHFGRLPRVSLLLSNGAPLEQRDAFGGTAMAAAVLAGRSAVVSALASAGAGPYAPLTGTPSSTLQGHTGAVVAFSVLPDGRLASGSGDNTIRVWRPSDGRVRGRAGGAHELGVCPRRAPRRPARVWEQGQDRSCVAPLDGRVRGRARGSHVRGAVSRRAPRWPARVRGAGWDSAAVVVAGAPSRGLSEKRSVHSRTAHQKYSARRTARAGRPPARGAPFTLAHAPPRKGATAAAAAAPRAERAMLPTPSAAAPLVLMPAGAALGLTE